MKRPGYITMIFIRAAALVSFIVFMVILLDTCVGQEIIHPPVEVINTTPKNTTRLYPNHWKSQGLPSKYYRIMFNGNYYCIDFSNPFLPRTFFDRVYTDDYSESVFRNKEDAVKLAWIHYYKKGKRCEEEYLEDILRNANYEILQDTFYTVGSSFQWDSVNQKLIEIKP